VDGLAWQVMNRIRLFFCLALFFALLLSSTQARPHFEQGDLRVGAALGLRGTEEGVSFSIGGACGFFVLDGLELSIEPLFQTGGGEPTLFMLTADVTFIPLTDLVIAPYIRGGGGRLFVLEGVDAWIASAGGGLIYLFGPWYGIDIGGGYRWFFFPEDEIAGSYYVRAGLVLLF